MNIDAATWIQRAGDRLRRAYGVTIEDAGYSEGEFFSRWMDQGATPEEAIATFTEKYDLDPMTCW